VRPIALIALAIAASACMGSDHHASSDLEITVRVATSTAAIAQGEIAFRTERYSLNCDRPPRGSMPNPANACTAVADLGLPHSPASCQGQREPVMGSVTVTGSFRGKPVHLRITTDAWCGASADLREDYEALLLPDPGVVPNVVGLPVLRAAGVLQRAGFTASIPTSMAFGSLTPMPLIDGQSVTAGVLAERGSDVALTLRSGCCTGSPDGTTGRVRMPRLVGLDARHAIGRLRHAGLDWLMRLRPVETASGPLLDAFVVQQSPQPGVSLRGRDAGIRIPEFTADYGESTSG
jgi:hypothetical protein